MAMKSMKNKQQSNITKQHEWEVSQRRAQEAREAHRISKEVSEADVCHDVQRSLKEQYQARQVSQVSP